MLGHITVITGPMFSEKSGELIRRCQKLKNFGRKQVIAYKPIEDNRFRQNEIVSRIGYKLTAQCIPQQLHTEIVQQILNETTNIDVVAFDEAQFFSQEIVYLVDELAHRGKQVIVDGLNRDYRGHCFGYIGELLAIADDVKKLTAFCAVCGRSDASFTQRIINKQPATLGPIVLIGDSEAYEPRCRNCFIPPHRAHVPSSYPTNIIP